MKLKTVFLSLSTSILLVACSANKPVSILPLNPESKTSYFDLVRPLFSGDEAYETTAFVEKYWRVAGNTGFNATINHIATNLEKAGYVLESEASAFDRLTYRIEKREMKKNTWEPVDASLSIVGSFQKLLEQTTNRNMVYLNSASTPPEGVIAEIVYLKDKSELNTIDFKDKIVFAEMSAHVFYKKALIEGGAIGLITYTNPTYLQPEKNITSIQFRSLPYNDTIPAWGIALSYDAKEKLKSALQNGKVSVKVDIKTKIYPSEELTIIADIKGAELPKESLVFSAHIQEPGANDNATGVGAQLEMAIVSAKLIQEKKIDAKRTLTFLWGDEIISTNRYIVEKEKRKSEINWGISLDMVGENTSVTGGSFLIEKMPDPSAIWTRGKDKHSEWGGKVLSLDEMKPHYFNDFIIHVFKQQGKFANWEVNTNPFEGGSDHTPFLNANLPGLLLWHFTDQFYHTDNDRIDKVSKETLKNVGTAALVSAYTLINSDASSAKEIISNTLNAAKNRLQDEFELSKKAIAEGKLIIDEIQILEAWKNWYNDALGSISDVAPTSELLKKDISEAQKVLKTFADKLIDGLSK